MKTAYIPLLAGILATSSIAFSQAPAQPAQSKPAAAAPGTGPAILETEVKLEKSNAPASADPAPVDPGSDPRGADRKWDHCGSKATDSHFRDQDKEICILSHPQWPKKLSDQIAQLDGADAKRTAEIKDNIGFILNEAEAERKQIQDLVADFKADTNAINGNSDAIKTMNANLIALETQNRINSMKAKAKLELQTRSYTEDAYDPTPYTVTLQDRSQLVLKDKNTGNLDFGAIANLPEGSVGTLDVIAAVVNDAYLILASDRANENPDVKSSWRDPVIEKDIAEAQALYAAPRPDYHGALKKYEAAYHNIIDLRKHKFDPIGHLVATFQNNPPAQAQATVAPINASPEYNPAPGAPPSAAVPAVVQSVERNKYGWYDIYGGWHPYK
jgi:hypothetical protein